MKNIMTIGKNVWSVKDRTMIKFYAETKTAQSSTEELR